MNRLAWGVPEVIWLFPIAQILLIVLIAMIALYALRQGGDARILVSRKPLRIEIERKEKRESR